MEINSFAIVEGKNDEKLKNLRLNNNKGLAQQQESSYHNG